MTDEFEYTLFEISLSTHHPKLVRTHESLDVLDGTNHHTQSLGNTSMDHFENTTHEWMRSKTRMNEWLNLKFGLHDHSKSSNHACDLIGLVRTDKITENVFPPNFTENL